MPTQSSDDKREYNTPACKYCGRSHAPRQCSAFGKVCRKCGGSNHFASVCLKGRSSAHSPAPSRRPVHTVESGETSGLFIGTVYVGEIDRSGWHANLFVCSQEVCFKLDSGADANVLPLETYERLGSGSPLMETTTVLTAFGNAKIRPDGEVKLPVVNPHTSETRMLDFYVTRSSDIAILGCKACIELDLVRRVSVDTVAENDVLTEEKMRAQYSDVFTGLGEYEKEYHIEVDSNVKPVIQRCRKVPYARYDKLKHTLVDLEKRGVIASVDRPTEWVHNLVITEKRDGRMRVCLDPKPLNVAIKRERYEIPTPADVQSRLSGMCVFTVIDMQDAYWHVRLSPESSYLCTFHTPWGRKRFLRMPFGISSASEVMQKRNEEAFGDIQGVHVIADDLIISAKDEAEHDAIILRVLERARQQNVKFNANKIQYKVNTVTYMGHIVSAEGMRPDPRKVEAIVNMPRPSDRQGLMRLLGMIKYLAQYIPNESSITAPLRLLLKQDVEWSRQPEHDVAMQLVRETLARDTVLTFYDVRKPATIQADASQSGLGCGLMQQGRPVAFASRALTEAEQNYSQIEKEMLAISFACQKFHQYIYGKSIDVHSDHRPLESIMKKPIGKASPRLQRMMLQLQRYTLNVRYVPGKLMYVADTLSRAYITGDAECGAPEEMEVLVHSLVENLPATIDKLEQFRRAFANDEVMQKLKQYIRNGWPQRKSAALPEIQAYWDIRDELHEAEGLLLFGERLVVPASLRPDMLQVIHEGHLGRDKCKARARVSLYWPLMGVDIEEVVGRCAVCQKYRAANQKEPLIPHSVPALRWQQVALDIMTHKGKDYLVAVDYLSKFPEIALLERKTAACVIMHLKSMFARHGIADHLIRTLHNHFSTTFV